MHEWLSCVPFLACSPTDARSGTALRHRRSTARTFGVVLTRWERRGAPLAAGGKPLSRGLTDEQSPWLAAVW